MNTEAAATLADDVLLMVWWRYMLSQGPVMLARFLPTSQNLSAIKHTRTSVLRLAVQFHALVLSAFASLIAPFGGFFASGFKRGFKIKDFGDSIPGHGGMTDRMDCQVGLRSTRANIWLAWSAIACSCMLVATRSLWFRHQAITAQMRQWLASGRHASIQF